MKFLLQHKNTIGIYICLILLIFGIVSSRIQRSKARSDILKSNDSLRIELQRNTFEIKELRKYHGRF